MDHRWKGGQAKADHMKKGEEMEEIWKVSSLLSFTCHTYNIHNSAKWELVDQAHIQS